MEWQLMKGKKSLNDVAPNAWRDVNLYVGVSACMQAPVYMCATSCSGVIFMQFHPLWLELIVSCTFVLPTLISPAWPSWRWWHLIRLMWSTLTFEGLKPYASNHVAFYSYMCEKFLIYESELLNSCPVFTWLLPLAAVAIKLKLALPITTPFVLI